MVKAQQIVVLSNATHLQEMRQRDTFKYDNAV
jgi:hypothetical protein